MNMSAVEGKGLQINAELLIREVNKGWVCVLQKGIDSRVHSEKKVMVQNVDVLSEIRMDFTVEFYTVMLVQMSEVGVDAQTEADDRI